MTDRRLFPKKRIEIIVERALLGTVVDAVIAAGAKGHTVIPAIAGRGASGVWRVGEVSEVDNRLQVIVIADEVVAMAIVEEAARLADRYALIVTVADVLVVRGERF